MRTVFHFDSDGVEAGTLKVFRFEGEERVSHLYKFQIDLVAEDDSLDLEAILNAQASIGFERDGKTLSIHGILCSFEQLGQTPYSTHYRAVLVPRLWLLTQRRQNQIYQEMTVQDIVAEKLTDAGLTTDDFEFRLIHDYQPREYVVQYRETDLDFAARLMEHEGMFYFFEQQDDGEKLIIGDDNVTFDELPQASPIQFFNPSGMESAGQESVQALICRQRRVVKNVVLKEYNYRKPSMNMKVEPPKLNDGAQGGLISEYGDHFRTDEDGNRLAKTRAEELLVQEKVFLGESDCTAFRSGFLYSLSGHYRSDFDQQYILTGVRHVGWQSIPGIEGLKADGVPAGLEPDAEGTAYRNEFTSITKNVAFRPERTTPKPKLHGVMNAHVDAAGDGEYAELDDEGRYKVIVPFDLSGKGGGKATRFIRMAQPYAGAGYGLHAPLHKGTEVIWTCVDGDLDRPVIVGALPNPQNRSPVVKANQSQSVFRTAAQNQLCMEDRSGAEMCTLETPYENSTLFLGAAPSSTGIIATTDGHGVIHAKKGIYLNAWPSDYWTTGDAAKYMNAGISAAKVIGVAAAAAAAGKLGALPVAAGAAGVAAGLAFSGITLASPGGISAITLSTFTAVGVAGVSLLTPAAAAIVGGANASLMSGGGVNIYTVSGGIRMVSSRGDIDIKAKSADVKVQAKANVIASAGNNIAMEAHSEVDVTAQESDITLHALAANVEVSAKKKILLTAEDEEILLQCGDSSISLLKDGTINIKGKIVVVKGEEAKLQLDSLGFELETERGGEIMGDTLEVTAETTHTIKGKLIKINP